MNRKPFVELTTRRIVPVAEELPDDLAEFYALNEGVGLESSYWDHPVRLCKLNELARVTWKDLGFGGQVPDGWDPFAAIYLAFGMFFEKVVYVLDAPSCPPGSILALGNAISGPGGTGPAALESTLVLAESFQAWLIHLEQLEWVEPAISGPDRDWTDKEKQEIYRYYLALNPRLPPDQT